MPTVPRLSSPQVEQTALPNVRFQTDMPLEAFGGGAPTKALAGAVVDIGSEIAKQEERERRQANDVVVKDAYKQGLTGGNALMYDPQNGAFTKRGKDAFGVVDEYVPQYKKQLDDIEGGLANEDQKNQFRAIRSTLEANLQDSLQKHVFTESKKFSDETNLGGVKALTDDAVLNYQTPGRVQQNIEKQKAFLEGYAQDNGISGPAKENFFNTQISKTYTAVLERMLANGQDREAKAFFDENRSGFHADDIATVEKQLKIGSTRGESQRLADDITIKYKSMTDAVDEVRKISDPELRDATNARVKEFFSEQAAARARDQETMFQDAWNRVRQSGSMDAVPPATLAKLSPQQQKSLGQALHVNETNLQKYYEFEQMASDPNRRNEFLKLGFSDLAPHLSENDFKTVAGWQAGLRKQDEATLQKLDGIQSNSQIRDSMMSAAGIDPTPKPNGSVGAQNAARVKNMADQQIAEYYRRTGKQPTNAEVKGMMDEILKDVILSRGMIWNSTEKLYNVKPGVEFDVDLKDIPKPELIKIDDYLRRQGITPTDTQRILTYKKKLKAMVDRAQ